MNKDSKTLLKEIINEINKDVEAGLVDPLPFNIDDVKAFAIVDEGATIFHLNDNTCYVYEYDEWDEADWYDVIDIYDENEITIYQ